MSTKAVLKLLQKACVCAFFLVLALIVLSESESYLLRGTFDFKDQSESEIAIFGHSHIQTAVNDSLISNLKSYANSGESYYYSYSKLKQIVKDNPQIKAVFIEFSNNVVKNTTDKWIWRDKYIRYKYVDLEPLVAIEDKALLLKKNPIQFVRNYLRAFRIKSKMIINDQANEYYSNSLGGYNYLDRNKTDSLLKERAKRSVKYIDRPISKENLSYLDMMINLLEQNNIQVFLFRSPIHPESIQFLNEENFNNIREQRYANIRFLDFGNISFESSQFADLEHLNFKGASRFSLWLDDLISKGLLDINDTSQFIAKRVSEFNQIDQKQIKNKIALLNDGRTSALLKDIVKNGEQIPLDAEFTDQLKLNNAYVSANEGNLLFLLGLENLHNVKTLDSLLVGIHLDLSAIDYKKRPNRMINKNLTTLKLNSKIEIHEISNDSYIFLNFELPMEVSQVKTMNLFLRNSGQFRYRLGSKVHFDSMSL